MKQYILDAQGNPVLEPNLLEWAVWFKRTKERQLEHFVITRGHERILVSTVFLGLDHNFSENGPPVLWETMIFGGERDGYQERYSSKEAALAGHERAVKIAKGEIESDGE